MNNMRRCDVEYIRKLVLAGHSDEIRKLLLTNMQFEVIDDFIRNEWSYRFVMEIAEWYGWSEKRSREILDALVMKGYLKRKKTKNLGSPFAYYREW